MLFVPRLGSGGFFGVAEMRVKIRIRATVRVASLERIVSTVGLWSQVNEC